MKKTKILFIVPYPSEGASNRLRIEQYLPYMDREDVIYRLRPFAGRRFYKILYAKGHRIAKSFYFLIAILNRFLDIVRAVNYDIVVVHREALPIGSTVIERAFLGIGKKIVFDFDDAVFLSNTSASNNFIERFKNPGKVSRVISLSSCVLAGNAYLAEYAKKFNDNVVVMPTAIDTDAYTINAVKKDSSTVTIGWIGSFTTGAYLEDIRGVLNRLKAKYPFLKLKFVGNWIELKNPIEGAEYKEWRLEHEKDDLGSFDIGIMPMPDDMWTRGKCGFKIILYMACGIPVVSSPVGVNKEIVRDGENGFLADTEDEWFSKLSALIDDSLLRKRFGVEGRKTVERCYSVSKTVGKFIGILKEVSAGRIYDK